MSTLAWAKPHVIILIYFWMTQAIPSLSHQTNNSTFIFAKTCDPGMPSTLLEEATQRLPRRFSQSGCDVFCLVKAFVSDDTLSQPALLVLPGQSVVEVVEPALRKLGEADCPRHLTPVKDSAFLSTECFKTNALSQNVLYNRPMPRNCPLSR